MSKKVGLSNGSFKGPSAVLGQLKMNSKTAWKHLSRKINGRSLQVTGQEISGTEGLLRGTQK